MLKRSADFAFEFFGALAAIQNVRFHLGSSFLEALDGRFDRTDCAQRRVGDADGSDLDHPFARDCRRACQLVERGVRFVTVNMFTTVYDTLSWDCHADGGALGTTWSWSSG